MDHLGESAIGNAQLDMPRFRPPPASPSGVGAPARPAAGAIAAPAAPAVPAGGGLPAGIANIRLPFPWFNCYCGDIDLIGELKPQGYYRRVLWRQGKLEVAVQRPLPPGRTEVVAPWGWSDELRSWTWPGYEGRALTVRVYSTGDAVRLLLNGKEVGMKAVSRETELRAEFEVPYASGDLTAIAVLNGKPIAELDLKTVGASAKLRLRADRGTIGRGADALAYVTAEVLDEAGSLVPDAVIPVGFTVTGVGRLEAAGSANPKDVFSFRQRRPNTFHGQCLAIVRPANARGRITVQAEAPGLAAARVAVEVS